MTISNASLESMRPFGVGEYSTSFYTHLAAKDMDDLLRVELKEIERYIEYRDTLAPAVSSVNVGWHLVHLLKVINQAYGILESSDPAAYEGPVNRFRSAVFLSGSLPRGRGQAPQSTQPVGEVSREEIVMELEAARLAIGRMKELPKTANFYHGALGQLDVEQTKKFLVIHTHHHLEIIRDILEE